MSTEARNRSETGALSSRDAFVAVFVLVLIFSYSLLYAANTIPELDKVAEEEGITGAGAGVAISGTSTSTDSFAEVMGDVPRRVIIDAIKVDVLIVNPESRDINVLDQALLEGVVHYPGSGNLEDNSNLFLFGHSSYLPSVRNKAFQALNDLHKLKKGDVIRVLSDEAEYIYRVAAVELVDAGKALVELSEQEKKLTLSTCNSFGAPSERFVVEADFLARSAFGD